MQQSPYEIIRSIASAQVRDGESMVIDINGMQLYVSPDDIAAANLILAAIESQGEQSDPDDLLSIFNAGIFWIELMVRLSMAEVFRHQIPKSTTDVTPKRRPRKSGGGGQDGTSHRRGM